VVPQTASSIGSTLELSTSSEYLSRDPDRHAGDSAWKPRHVAETLSRYGGASASRRGVRTWCSRGPGVS
jgi:hypothetical protein